MPKVALVIASHGFQPVEYGDTKKSLEEAEIQVVTVSDKPGQAESKDGAFVSVDVVLSEMKVEDYDAVYFIGGPGALECLDNQESNRVLNEAMILQKPYGAICIAPRILAKANVLVGKKATGWNNDGELQTIFANNNVEYVAEPVVKDGKIITADGPAAAREFGNTIAQLLKS